MRETQKHEVFCLYFHFHKNFLRLTAVSFWLFRSSAKAEVNSWSSIKKTVLLHLLQMRSSVSWDITQQIFIHSLKNSECLWEKKEKHSCFWKPVVFRKNTALLLSNYKFSSHKPKSIPCMGLSEYCFLQRELGRIIGWIYPNQNTNQWKLVGLGWWWGFFACLFAFKNNNKSLFC